METEQLNRHLKFNEPTEAVKFLEREADWWEWLLEMDTRSDISNLDQMQDLYYSLKIKLNELAARARDETEPLRLVRQSASNIYQETEALISTDRRAQFVRSFARRPAAVAALGYFHNSIPDLDNKAVVDGVISAILFKKGVTRDAKKEIAKARKEWPVLLEEARGELSSLTDHVTQQRDETSERLQELRSRVGTLRNEVGELKRSAESQLKNILSEADEKVLGFEQIVNAKSEEIIGSAREELRKIKESYRTQLVLRSPVDFWKDKKENHSNDQGRYGKMVLAAGLVFTLVLIAFGLWLFDDSDALQVRELTVFLVASTFVFGLIRVLLRMYLSSVFLRTDAQERVVMTKTYLTLLEQEGTTEEEKRVIMEALFRPALAAARFEESTSSSALETLAKFVAPRR